MEVNVYSSFLHLVVDSHLKSFENLQNLRNKNFIFHSPGCKQSMYKSAPSGEHKKLMQDASSKHDTTMVQTMIILYPLNFNKYIKLMRFVPKNENGNRIYGKFALYQHIRLTVLLRFVGCTRSLKVCHSWGKSKRIRGIFRSLIFVGKILQFNISMNNISSHMSTLASHCILWIIDAQHSAI